MAFWNRKAADPEQRASIEDPRVPISSSAILDFLGVSGMSEAGVTVTLENALGVPAIWAAVNFISGTMAGLPLHVYQKTEEGRERVGGQLGALLHDAVNDECSSFEWRKYKYERALTGGRGLTFIERNVAGRIINLWPLNPLNVTVKRINGRRRYILKEAGRTVTYESNEVIDVPFMLDADMCGAHSPILKNKDTVGLAIAATTYGSRLFNNGGIPPFVMTGNFQSGAGLNRASADLEQAVRDGAKERRLALTLPTGHEIKALGLDPEKSQLVEVKRFIIEEVARIYSIPPTFLQDLTNGTFSNTEQGDLHFVKHTIKRWVEQTEQELNLKLFGRGNTKMYVEFNLDGLLRGDFKTRMDGYATGIQNGVLTPNEARRQENRPDMDEGNKLMIQGATIPLGSQPITPPATQGTSNEA
jgi:HK97 family phage portal protein